MAKKYTVYDNNTNTKLLETTNFFDAENLCIYHVVKLGKDSRHKTCKYSEEGNRKHYICGSAHYVIEEEE